MYPLNILVATATLYSITTRAAFVFAPDDAALFIAIAVPIDLPRYKVFLSYNFEAHYPVHDTWRLLRHSGHLNGTHGGLANNTNFDFDDNYDYYGDVEGPDGPHKKKHKIKPSPKPENATVFDDQRPPPKPKEEEYKDFFEDFPMDGGREAAEAKNRISRSLLSRTTFYEILKRRFEQHGFGSGDECLLRLICEVNNSLVGEVNGLLGNLVHVMFSPSSSMFEALPERYYEAELHGTRDYCEPYQRQCKRSILGEITQPLTDFIAQMDTNKI
ncbi:uncharacterized protein LOC115634737 [Scaptodrosophila lebanonensis]|uniref:Uncharacterized protein LOC115634737 n=1 Tax=Drosophila lebanonensis TaxID=7225 RepID=A0A6J2UJW3_DROLE|nr:uncharacterized protein LOC115634737 [Scaptodrosophila lebanonensis]